MRLKFFAVILIVLLYTTTGMCTVTGNIGNPFIWNNGIFTGDKKPGYTLSIDSFSEKITLGYQRDRFAAVNWNISPPEERHKEIGRTSDNDFKATCIQLGVTLDKNSLIFLDLGVSNNSLKFSYVNEMYNASSGASYSKILNFSSSNDLYFGFGTALVLHRTKIFGKKFTAGLNFSYHYWEMEDDEKASTGYSYSYSLNELQGALLSSIRFEKFSPYAGFKINGIFGNEKFTDIGAHKYYVNGTIENELNTDIDKNDGSYNINDIHYSHDIDVVTNKNMVFGLTYFIKKWCSLNIEYQNGDSEASGLTLLTKF